MRISLSQKYIFFTIATLFFISFSVWGFYAAKMFAPGFSNIKQSAVAMKGVTTVPVESSLKLVVISTPVFVTLPNATKEIEIVEPTQLKAGSLIRTGSLGRAELHYPNKSVTRLDFKTKVLIKQIEVSPQKSIIELIQGSIWSRVAKLLGRETFVTETATMVATVRGTAYGMSIQPDGTETVFVEEGAVMVDTPTIDEQVIREDTSIVVNQQSSNPPVIKKVNLDATQNEWIRFNLNKDAEWSAKIPEKNTTITATPFLPQNPGNGNGTGIGNGVQNGNGNGVGNGNANGNANGVGGNTQPTSEQPTSVPQNPPAPENPPANNGNANGNGNANTPEKDKNPDANGNGNANGHDKEKKAK